jgi:succinate dehydrogenase / fumarate reductase flavoprotein subunit
VEQIERFEHDVLVIGAGGAGLRAAIEAQMQGANVGLVTKSLLGKAHTVMAEGGVAAAMGNVDPQDNWQVHFKDTMLGGKMMNHWRMAQLHAQQAPERVLELEQWGALFDRTPNGTILQRAFGGHSCKRLAHVGDRTGLEIIRTLQERAVATQIPVYMECTITHLLRSNGQFTGALGYWRQNGKFVVLSAKTIILATGGVGKSYRVTSNSWEYTSDGLAMAFRHGAEMIDMEFVQFHPTGMVWPPGVKGILVTEAVRGEGGRLTNNKGERFMERYDPKRMELSTRDQVARAIYTEVKEGRGSEHGGVYLSVTHLDGESVKKKLPSMYHQFKDLADVDITKAPMEVGPTTHYMMGGLRVDPDTGETTLPGLYAAGEVAGGMHGGNRLGGNSLSDLLVFGKLAGEAAAKKAKSMGKGLAPDPAQIEAGIAEFLAPMQRTEGPSAYEIHDELQDVMQNLVGIMRIEGDLKLALEKLAVLKEKQKKVRVTGGRIYNPGWHLAYDLGNLINTSIAIATAALAREESRGAHTRLDHPKTSPEWEKITHVIQKDGDGLKLSQMPKPQMPPELAKLFEDAH